MADDAVSVVGTFLKKSVRRLDFRDMTLEEIQREGPSLDELGDQISISEDRMFVLWQEFVAEGELGLTITKEHFADIMYDSFNADLIPNREGPSRWLGYTNDVDD